jgi:hypothetical protein
MDLKKSDELSIMTWSDFLSQVHIIVNPNNVVWFSIKQTTHLNLTPRSPTLWMEYLYPNLTSDWRNSDNLDNNPPPDRTNPSRIVCLFMLVLHALLVIFLVCASLFVDARAHRIEDVERTDGVPKTSAKGIGNQTRNIIVSERRHSFPLHYMPWPLPFHHHHILLASSINSLLSISTN